MAGVAALVALVVFGVYSSSLFTITRVVVEGTNRLDADDVRDRVVLPEGATLLRLPARTIVSTLESDPWIAEVTLSRRIPSTLRVVVQERVPVALVDTGTSFWFIDGAGRFLGETSLESTASPVPVVRDVPALAPIAGSITDAGALLNALDVLAGIETALAAQVRAISAASPYETTLITDSGVEVMVGEATQLPEKSGIALGIMEEQGPEVVFIDVRSIERPISRGLSR